MSAQRAAWWTLMAVLAALPAAGMLTSADAAAARASVAPVLSCGGGMVLDSGSGSCLTPRTETALRPSSCPAGSTRVGGEYGGHVCQRRVTQTVDTGRTRQVYSHTTYSRVWVSTGTERVQTGTTRSWVPARRVTTPLVPPVRYRTGSVRRCDFDPISRQRYNCRSVPTYGYRTTHTVTIPGYWRETPVYETRETGYWDRVPTIHYTTEPVYRTVTRWATSPATQGSCPSGWRAVGSQCSRTVLGPPTAAPSQSCPSGSVPRYGDPIGGNAPVLSCQPSAPGSDLDDGDDQEDGGGPDTTRDGRARPLHHLAGESDERLAELGIHRCANGLLSYVPCSDLPGRTWDSDADVCDGIEGTTYRPDHGGTCVTGSDLLNKCTTPGDCEETTIRTYCPAIRELSTTQIQQHVHPHRGAETYRVCVFDCSNFAGLPPYVRTRINGSYDYGCLPVPDDEPPATTTTAPTTTTTAPGDDDDRNRRTDATVPDVTQPDTSEPDTTAPDTTEPDTTEPTPTTVAVLDDDCGPVPPAIVAAQALDELSLVSHVRVASRRQSPQREMPGDGRFLQVAPGRGWAALAGPVDVAEGDCRWSASWVRVAWAGQRPWVAAERRAMQTDAGTRHLARRWDAMSADQQTLVRQWHRPGAIPAEVVCRTVDAASEDASTACGWLLRSPAAYAWQAAMCFESQSSSVTPRSPRRNRQPAAADPCWVALASGVDWIRSVGAYADGRVTFTQSGGSS